jgi:hypothetical protein
MIKFYTNRDLSQIFGVNLAKWKRWSREFLPPDPLGGLQSGYARQYNLDEAFSIFLGGHLVGELKFTIPESRQILNDLNQWLIDHAFYFDFSGRANFETKSPDTVRHYHIVIFNRKISNHKNSGLHYLIKTAVTSDWVEVDGIRMHQERFIEETIGLQDGGAAEDFSAASFRGFNISALRQHFLDCLQTYNR